jgi:predicted membrane-bound spermidine synthase
LLARDFSIVLFLGLKELDFLRKEVFALQQTGYLSLFAPRMKEALELYILGLLCFLYLDFQRLSKDYRFHLVNQLDFFDPRSHSVLD